jgi:hypothetical protein
MAVWCSLWSFGIFSTIWYVWTKKNLATLIERQFLAQNPNLCVRGISEIERSCFPSNEMAKSHLDRRLPIWSDVGELHFLFLLIFLTWTIKFVST